MKPMDKYDQPFLHSAGFEPGWSGQSWFGEDREGNTWQAYLDDKSVFAFRSCNKERKWGVYSPMNIATFRKVFFVDGEE